MCLEKLYACKSIRGEKEGAKKHRKGKEETEMIEQREGWREEMDQRGKIPFLSPAVSPQIYIPVCKHRKKRMNKEGNVGWIRKAIEGKTRDTDACAKNTL